MTTARAYLKKMNDEECGLLSDAGHALTWLCDDVRTFRATIPKEEMAACLEISTKTLERHKAEALGLCYYPQGVERYNQQTGRNRLCFCGQAAFLHYWMGLCTQQYDRRQTPPVILQSISAWVKEWIPALRAMKLIEGDIAPIGYIESGLHHPFISWFWSEVKGGPVAGDGWEGTPFTVL
ncbi:MAG: hypothetical protein EOM20_07160 [Spartobacteria bacterium]|nr:hypothetical protein [Spartobacteria bacterium]